MSKSSDDTRDPLADWGAWDDYKKMMQDLGEIDPVSFEPDHPKNGGWLGKRGSLPSFF